MSIDEKVQEKLKHFTTVTIENVELKCREELDKYKAEGDAELEQYKKEAVRLAKLEEKNLRESIMRKMSKKYSIEQQNIRRELNIRRSMLEGKLYEEVDHKLKEYRKTKEYETYLAGQINKAASYAEGADIDIYIDKGDAHLKSSLEKMCHVELLVYEVEFKGGIRAEIPKRNMLIDFTFETKLEELDKTALGIVL